MHALNPGLRNWQEEFISYKSVADITLSGTLTSPDSKGLFPAVILIAGAGQSCRDAEFFGHKPFQVLAEYLSSRGIAVLRFDKRGCGESTGNFNMATTADFSDDVLAGVEFLKSHKEVNPKQIGLIGWSEGGIIAPMTAARSQDIAFAVLMAACAVSGEEFMYGWNESVQRAKGASKQAIEKDYQHKKMLFDVLKNEDDLDIAAKQLREIMIKYSHSKQELTCEDSKAVDVELGYLNTPWFRYFLSYDPSIALKQLKIPLLALNGELDQQVISKQNLSVIGKALEEGGNKDYKLIELPKLNHLFQTCHNGSFLEYAQIKETIAPHALNLIAEWILERTTR
ncbi:MAG: alpha/beta fold hydrolase [Parachlamydiaceae bacterium]|nr:alpha/beta fold hydrolase [Parachlamydiaceae bacterium]